MSKVTIEYEDGSVYTGEINEDGKHRRQLQKRKY